MIGKSGVDFECILDKRYCCCCCCCCCCYCFCYCFCRGFYPKGGGQVTLLSKPIDRSLSSFEITTKGVITKIDVEVFTAGGVPRRVKLLIVIKRVIKVISIMCRWDTRCVRLLRIH